MLPNEGWSREAPVPGTAFVEPGQSVNPPRESQHLRDKHKDDPDQQSSDSAESSERGRPPADAARGGAEDYASASPVHTYLQAVDPETGQVSIQAVDPSTGHVIWQAPLPEDPIQDTGMGHQESSSPPALAEDESPQSTGLLGKRAYEHHDDDRAGEPRVERTA
jgi:hypothetical protein